MDMHQTNRSMFILITQCHNVIFAKYKEIVGRFNSGTKNKLTVIHFVEISTKMRKKLIDALDVFLWL